MSSYVRATPRPGHAVREDGAVPVHATAAAEPLRTALETLDAEVVHLSFRPGAVDLTLHDAAAAVWETVFVSAAVAGLEAEVRRGTAVDGRTLMAALDGPGEVELRLARNGALMVDDLVLTPSAAAVADPPRPDASGVLQQRLALPATAAIELILRLEGPNVCVPKPVRERFSARQVSSVSLFERSGDWFISGVRNGTPHIVVVGAVGVY